MMAKTGAGLPAAQPRQSWTRFLVTLLLGGAVLAGVAITILERLTPDLIHLPFTVNEVVAAPRIAVTDTSGIDTKIGTIDFRTDFDVPDLGAANSFGTSLSTNTIRNNLKMNNRNKTRNTSVFSIDLLDPSIRP